MKKITMILVIAAIVFAGCDNFSDYGKLPTVDQLKPFTEGVTPMSADAPTGTKLMAAAIPLQATTESVSRAITGEFASRSISLKTGVSIAVKDEKIALNADASSYVLFKTLNASLSSEGVLNLNDWVKLITEKSSATIEIKALVDIVFANYNIVGTKTSRGPGNPFKPAGDVTIIDGFVKGKLDFTISVAELTFMYPELKAMLAAVDVAPEGTITPKQIATDILTKVVNTKIAAAWSADFHYGVSMVVSMPTPDGILGFGCKMMSDIVLEKASIGSPKGIIKFVALNQSSPFLAPLFNEDGTLKAELTGKDTAVALDYISTEVFAKGIYSKPADFKWLKMSFGFYGNDNALIGTALTFNNLGIFSELFNRK